MKKILAGKDKYPMSLGVKEAYREGQEDEAMEPIVLFEDGKPVGRIDDGDYVIFYDIRGEREVELTRCFTDENFNHFPTKKMKVGFVTMIQYDKNLNVKVAFPPIEEIKDTLSETVSKHNLKQVKISETEKAIHVSYFLNGKRKDPFLGEERVFIPSPKDVKNYDEKPEMSIAEVTKATLEKINDPSYDLIITNFANTDVVGHIENESAIKKAVESVDKHTGIIVEEAKKNNITLIISADHGTVERWLYPEGAIDTGHTISPVPFIIIDPLLGKEKKNILRNDGALTDIAPTILHFLGIEKPSEMTGETLLTCNIPFKKRRIAFLILDGWGINEETYGNLIAKSYTPVMDKLTKEYPYTTLKASGEAVGLPEGTVGNSEAGHLHIGAGRIIYSDRLRINHAIKTGEILKNEAFLWAMENAKKNNKKLHLLGIVSFFSSHGSIEHLFALMKVAKEIGVKELFIHSLLGRRGERPESGAIYIEKVEKEAEKLGIGKVVSVIGRFWALDREENWDRVEKTYKMLVYGI